MIKHIVFFNFKDFAEGATKAENIARGKAMLENLVGAVPTLVSMSAGPNIAGGSTAWDFALVAEFEDIDALQQYVVHPEHKKVSEFMGKVRSDRASVDFEF
jgi:hypothetical protein